MTFRNRKLGTWFVPLKSRNQWIFGNHGNFPNLGNRISGTSEPAGTHRNLRIPKTSKPQRSFPKLGTEFPETPEPARTRRNAEPNQATFRTSRTDSPEPATSEDRPPKTFRTAPETCRNPSKPGHVRNRFPEPVPSQNRSSPRTHQNHPKSILRKKPIAFCCWGTMLGGNVKTKGWDRETDKRQTDRHTAESKTQASEASQKGPGRVVMRDDRSIESPMENW